MSYIEININLSVSPCDLLECTLSPVSEAFSRSRGLWIEPILTTVLAVVFRLIFDGLDLAIKSLSIDMQLHFGFHDVISIDLYLGSIKSCVIRVVRASFM